MKNSPLATILVALLACAAIGSLILCWMYIHTTREIRTIQGYVTNIQQNQRKMQFLANDLVEYSKRNPQIDPILEEVGWNITKVAFDTSGRGVPDRRVLYGDAGAVVEVDPEGTGAFTPLKAVDGIGVPGSDRLTEKR